MAGAAELCRQASDVAGAAELCRRGPFDLIVCETQLCDGACSDLLRDQRARHGTRGLAFSADAYEYHVTAGLAAGFDAYLTQPASVETLMDAIRRVLAGDDVGPEA